MNPSNTAISSATDLNFRVEIFVWIVGFVCMGLLGLWFTESILIGLIIGALGGTCGLVLAFPEAPYAASSVLMGQFFSTILGWFFAHQFGTYWSTPVIVMGTVLACVTIFNAYYTPTDTHPVQARIRQHTCWGFLFFPNIFSTIAVIAYATHLNNKRTTQLPTVDINHRSQYEYHHWV